MKHRNYGEQVRGVRLSGVPGSLTSQALYYSFLCDIFYTTGDLPTIVQKLKAARFQWLQGWRPTDRYRLNHGPPVAC